jgi:hypothetical protein
VTQAALGGHYEDDHVLAGNEELKLVTSIVKLNENFLYLFVSSGHKHFLRPE